MSDSEVVSYIAGKIRKLEGNYFAVIEVDKDYAHG